MLVKKFVRSKICSQSKQIFERTNLEWTRVKGVLDKYDQQRLGMKNFKGEATNE